MIGALAKQMGTLYGTVNGFEGRPTQSQTDRMTALGKEFEAIAAEFDAVTQKELPSLNAGLDKEKMGAIKIIARADWEKKQEAK